MSKNGAKRAKEKSKQDAEKIRREKQKKLRADVVAKKQEKARLKERTTKQKEKKDRSANKERGSRGNLTDQTAKDSAKSISPVDKGKESFARSKRTERSTDIHLLDNNQQKSYADSNKIYRWDSHQEQEKYDSEILDRLPRFDDPNYKFNNLEGDQLKNALIAQGRFQKISHFRDKFNILTKAALNSNLDITKDGKLCLENNKAAKSFIKELKDFVGNEAKGQITDIFIEQVLGKGVAASLGILKMMGDAYDIYNNERFLNLADKSLDPARFEKKLRLLTEVMAKAERVGNPYERMEVLYSNYKEYEEAEVSYKKFVLQDQKLGSPVDKKYLLDRYEQKTIIQGD